MIAPDGLAAPATVAHRWETDRRKISRLYAWPVDYRESAVSTSDSFAAASRTSVDLGLSMRESE